MSLIIATGNLFDQEADIYVNTANCVGVMGKGIAKSISERWPSVEKDFRRLCGRGLNCEGVPDERYSGRRDDPLPPCLNREPPCPCKIHKIRPGHFLFSKTGEDKPKWILHLPTKRKWNNPSSLVDVEAGIMNMRDRLAQRSDHLTIAMPAPGCANGGLSWRDVLPLVQFYLDDVSLRHHTIISLEPRS